MNIFWIEYFWKFKFWIILWIEFLPKNKWMNKSLNQYLSFYIEWIKIFEWINKIFIVRKLTETKFSSWRAKPLWPKLGTSNLEIGTQQVLVFFLMKHGPKGDPNPKLRLSRWRTVSLRLKLGTKNWGPKGDPKPQKDPLGDLGQLKRTQLGCLTLPLPPSP